ncbi:MAG TPA: sugar ABC transporter substrate-binding protein [Mycobacteriales bacterium]|nr:sugar ABC transporter substrate-binding protein [Mycobacteriales bacterium]
MSELAKPAHLRRRSAGTDGAPPGATRTTRTTDPGAGRRPDRSPRRRAGGMAALAIPVVLALTLAACGSSDSGSGSGNGSSGGDITVGLITKTETNPFFVKMKEGAEKEAQAKGVKLMTAAGKFDGDNASQVTAIENMVVAGVKGILITPSDTKAIIPAIQKARDKGVLVIALDTPTDPQSAVDALFATNNFTAGELIGKYAKAVEGSKAVKIATLDLAPGITVGVLRHNGFLSGYGLAAVDNTASDQVTAPSVVCSQDTQGDQAKGQTAMENCLQKDPGINLVYTINEPAALGAYTALKAAGKEKDVLIVSVDGGCTGTKAVQDGKIAATSQQYPLKMAERGVDAVVDYAKTGNKVSGYTDTGVTLIAAKPASGVDSKDVAFGLANCWG